MSVRIRTAFAAGLALTVLASPMTAASSTFVVGNGYANLCSRLALADKFDAETLTMCDRAIDEEFLSKSDLAKTLVNRGVVHMRRKNLSSAARDFGRAETIAPLLPEIYINRAVVLIKQGRYADALPMVDKGIALSPSEPEKAYFNRGIAREATGDVRGAYLDFTKAVQLKPNWEAPQKELVRFEVRKAG